MILDAEAIDLEATFLHFNFRPKIDVWMNTQSSLIECAHSTTDCGQRSRVNMLLCVYVNLECVLPSGYVFFFTPTSLGEGRDSLVQ